MPIYEFQCQSCGNKVEVLQKISDEPLKDCSACGKPDMKKLVSAAAFRLSGTGWYETDFKSGDKKNLSNNSDKKKDVKKATPETTKLKTETKSDAKS